MRPHSLDYSPLSIHDKRKMYRRSKFLEVLLEIRQEMAREADYDVDFFAEIARSGNSPRDKTRHSLTDFPVPAESSLSRPRKTKLKDKPKT